VNGTLDLGETREGLDLKCNSIGNVRTDTRLRISPVSPGGTVSGTHWM